MFFGRGVYRGDGFSRWPGHLWGTQANPWIMAGAGLILLILVILVIWLLVRRRSDPPEIRILKEKLARGEITTEEYQHRLDVLKGK